MLGAGGNPDMFFDFDDFFRCSKKCWILTIISSKTLRNEAFQTLGVLKNDYSWPKAARRIFQSLF